ncbi:hypothetical protein R3P38DRAFT_3219426 [Favolaschia claudopus]|uniref:Uncharacterized protein n=1 Tax=Favolaschia claudopus TaxID=2862362 RepID=A0AAW0A2G7_9AGAR
MSTEIDDYETRRTRLQTMKADPETMARLRREYDSDHPEPNEDQPAKCVWCDRADTVLYRCREEDCPLLPACKECTLCAHGPIPFHDQQVWSGDAWRKTSLFEMGHVMMARHADDSPCPNLGETRIVRLLGGGMPEEIRVQDCLCPDQQNEESDEEEGAFSFDVTPEMWARLLDNTNEPEDDVSTDSSSGNSSD